MSASGADTVCFWFRNHNAPPNRPITNTPVNSHSRTADEVVAIFVRDWLLAETPP